jgi:hypothetical protein
VKHIDIAIANVSKTLAGHAAEVELMAIACERQLRRHVAPAWNLGSFSVNYFKDATTIPASMWKLLLLDVSDVDGALGYHDDTLYPDGKVFAKTILDNGGTILDGADSISVCLSHEACELVGDPLINNWFQRPDGVFVAGELCDPVEGDSYDIHVHGKPIAVSNFIFPEWFDTTPEPDAKFDYLGKLSEGWTMTAGGYQILIDPSKGPAPFQEFAKESTFPAWKKATKASALARTAKRGCK